MNKIKIGDKTLNTKVSLAPLAGITDYVLRSLIRKHSKTCLITTEMISSEALVQVPKTKILDRNDDHSPISYQLSGHKPQMMAKAAKILEQYADIIDINMGCPVNKVVKGQDGCALMKNQPLAADIVKAVKENVVRPVSVKFRLGYTANEENFVEYGVKMQEAGADFITIHARTRSQMYSGKADWAKIKELKQNVDIPVFANGDILSIESAIECLEQSNADGVAIGRGVLGDVTLISRIEHYLTTGEKLPPPKLEERVETLKVHLLEEIKLRGEAVGIKFVRKFYPYYINSVKDAAKYRAVLMQEENYDNIIKVLDDLCAKKHELCIY
ncbi:tRNA dihydrouridine synthase DusB, partial [bacterium]|nr:tRNA dihydrouridine synthase DusB [bacterium]